MESHEYTRKAWAETYRKISHPDREHDFGYFILCDNHSNYAKCFGCGFLVKLTEKEWKEFLKTNSFDKSVRL